MDYTHAKKKWDCFSNRCQTTDISASRYIIKCVDETSSTSYTMYISNDQYIQQNACGKHIYLGTSAKYGSLM